MKTILVVDDEEMNLKIVEFILSAQKHKVLKAKSGIEAVDILATKKVDLILLDIEMPVLDGFHTFELIKQNELNKDVPVIFLTASSARSVVMKAIQMGAVDYMKKPFLPEDLQEHVAKVFEETK